MATQTTHYGFTKPDPLNDQADISVLNGDLDTIDAQLYVVSQAVAAAVVRLVYNFNTSLYPTRPSTNVVPAGQVEYLGPVQPSDWAAYDTWVDIS